MFRNGAYGIPKPDRYRIPSGKGKEKALGGGAAGQEAEEHYLSVGVGEDSVRRSFLSLPLESLNRRHRADSDSARAVLPPLGLARRRRRRRRVVGPRRRQLGPVGAQVHAPCVLLPLSPLKLPSSAR